MNREAMPPRSSSFAEYDELTDLPTMMFFRRYAAAYVKDALRFGRDAYLVYFNIENFSTYNETFGFEEGDRLLRLTSVAIQDSFPGFLLSRFSEDHFFLVCQSNDVVAGIEAAHDAVYSLSHHANVMLKAGIYRVGEGFEVGQACDRAKIACESIAHRYDRVYRWYDDALNWYAERSHYVESHINEAVQKGWIKVYFQPIVRSVTGEVCEFEALARWDDPRYGMLSPMIFVEVLERAHLIHRLDAYVIRRACEIWHDLSQSGRATVPVSVNLSRLDFELCDAFKMVEDAARENDVPRQMLHVEITESALNENTDSLIETIGRFRRVGYQVWLDDFGSGYSSLNTLKDYVFDVVKIDMAFLREFNSKPKSRVIIAAIVNMAKQLGMQTLIEGVELPEQFDFLKEIGCEFMQGYLIGRPVTVEENLRRIDSGELKVANKSLAGYYDRLGAINTLSATPFEFSWESDPANDRTLSEMIPLALVERVRDSLQVLTSTQTFEHTLAEVGIQGVAELTKILNDPHRPEARQMHQAINTAILSGKTESVDLLENGMHLVARVRHVVSHDGVDALLLSMINLSQFANMTSESLLDTATQYLFAVYDEVNIVNLSNGLVSTIFRGNTVFPSTLPEELFTDAAQRFAHDFVHPDDRERCVRYLDLSNIDARVEASGRNYLSEAFRALDDKGSYSWITSVLVPMMVDGQRTVLVCVRPANRAVVASMNGKAEVAKDLLWDTLLDLVPAGIFWKDANRRFLGVNKNFLDFYSFDSVNDVLGKNDEEMGWHVDADPFKNNELLVLSQGEPVLNARGTCIAQGEVRNIMASKIPIYRNGEVVGLLGYFTEQDGDSGRHRLLYDGFDRMAETDQLTGVPNLRGLASSAMAFRDAYERGGSDCAYVVVDICDMNDLNEVYGHSFGNRILKVVAVRLGRMNGVSGVVARIGGDKFAVLRQVESAGEAEELAQELRRAVEDVREVDGMAMRLRCYTGFALFSEGADANEVLALADTRMHETRSR